MIHVYAFTDELRELPPLDGIDGAPLELRTVDGLHAVVSRRSGRTDSESLRSDALVHGTVVEALADRGAAVLPVRFGEEATDDDALGATVVRRAETLKRRLERVRGCVELGLRIVTPIRPTATTGAEYMRALRGEDVEIDGLHRELAELSREASLRRVGRDRLGAYLLPRASIGSAQAKAERFARDHPSLTVLCTGPWAPYSFAGAQA